MKLNPVAICVFLNIISHILAFSSGCRRPPGVSCCYNEYFDLENKTCRDPTKMSVVPEIPTTIRDRTEQRANTSKDAKGQILGMKLTSLPHGSEEHLQRQSVNSENNGEELEQISKHLQLMSISLFLIVSCVIILIPFLVYYIWTRTRKTKLPIGLKQLYAHRMNTFYPVGTMERGYTPLSHRERQVRSGRQSYYSTPQRNGRQSDYSTPQNIGLEPYISTL